VSICSKDGPGPPQVKRGKRGGASKGKSSRRKEEGKKEEVPKAPGCMEKGGGSWEKGSEMLDHPIIIREGGLERGVSLYRRGAQAYYGEGRWGWKTEEGKEGSGELIIRQKRWKNWGDKYFSGKNT